MRVSLGARVGICIVGRLAGQGAVIGRGTLPTSTTTIWRTLGAPANDLLSHFVSGALLWGAKQALALRGVPSVHCYSFMLDSASDLARAGTCGSVSDCSRPWLRHSSQLQPLTGLPLPVYFLLQQQSGFCSATVSFGVDSVSGYSYHVCPLTVSERVPVSNGNVTIPPCNFCKQDISVGRTRQPGPTWPSNTKSAFNHNQKLPCWPSPWQMTTRCTRLVREQVRNQAPASSCWMDCRRTEERTFPVDYCLDHPLEGLQ